MTQPQSRPPLILRATVDRWLADSGALSALPAAPQVDPDPVRRPRRGAAALYRIRVHITGVGRRGGRRPGSPFLAVPD
jgi:hypothetical protein